MRKRKQEEGDDKGYEINKEKIKKYSLSLEEKVIEEGEVDDRDETKEEEETRKEAEARA